jgi:DNA mismatch endonuclease, patch repair protein
MADVVDKSTRSRMMSGIRGKDTQPELRVRRFLHGLGFRYRLHDRKLPGCPDIVLAKYRTVVEVRGCFWHCHTNCRFAVMPQSNGAFWAAKLAGTVERDRRNGVALRKEGWQVLVIWECQVDDEAVLRRFAERIRAPKTTKPKKA